MHLTGWQQSTVPRPRPKVRPCSSVVSEENTMRSTPSAVKNPTQNWCVDQIFRTRGIPTRSSERGFASTEGLAANQFSHVGMRTLILLQSRFHGLHLVDILDQPLRTGVAADDTLPALFKRNLAPWATGRARQLHVDEGALAVATAPAANRMVVGRAAIRERFDEVESAEPARHSIPHHLARAQRGAYGAGLARIGVNHYLRVGNFAFDEVNLRLDHSQVAMGPTLQHEFAADRAQILQLARIDPDVDGEDRCQRCHDLLGRPALPLLIDDVGLQKHAASQGKLWHGLGLERPLRIALERH